MPALAAQSVAPQLRSALGTNLNPIVYWSSQVPFINVMKSSSRWISGDSSQWDNQQPLDLDANGWVRSLAPGQVARTLMLWDIGDHYPAGQYLVRYNGEGTLNFGSAASVVPGSQKPGEMLLQVTPDLGGIYMDISATNPANYLRDIEIIMPGGICGGDPFTHVALAQACGSRRFLSFADNHRSILFYPVFADRLRAYSVLRFMNWMLGSSSESPVTNWSQRTLLSHRTWTTENGAPIEIMIALANRLDTHPWFNMPHAADDAYAQNFAQMVAARLDPALRVYVEYSNEVWNPDFAQRAYATAQGAAQVPPIDAMQYHALRSRTLGEILKGALGSARVVAVLGAQASTPLTASHGLDYLKSRFGTVGIDAVAIAPYLPVTPRPEQASTYTAMTLDDLFNYVRTSVLPVSVAMMGDYRTMTNGYGVRLISYEGGQHLVGIAGAENNDALTTLFHAFNRDPRIKQLYLDYLAGWKQAGGELFVHFTDVGRYDKWGAWGALEYIAQPRAAAPKFDAIQSFIEQNQVWWTQ